MDRKASHHHPRSPAGRQRGLSLIELMVSMAIGLGLLAALATVFSNTSSTQADMARSSQQIESGRFATQLLQDNVWHAGYYGRYVAYSTVDAAAALTALPDPCSTNIDPATASPTPLQSSLPFAIQGYDQPATKPAALTCLDAENWVPGTDILVVRRADSRTTAIGSVANDTYYLQSIAETVNLSTLKPISPVIAKGSTPAAFNLAGGPANEAGEIRRFHVQIYFISPCSVPATGTKCSAAGTDDGGVSIPTLKRLELATDGTFQIVPLVEGIENMQVDYGIDTVPAGLAGTQPYAGDGLPDSYKKAPSITEFTQVTAVRIFLLARATEKSADHDDGKTYALGLHGTYVPSGEAKKYKRHLYSTTIRVQNPAGWRES